jgi:uncharacterized cofD-like protein
MADSGGSSGRLRDAFGALPPGDVLRCLLALSTLPGDEARKIISRKFETGGVLKGHNAGNLLLTLLSQYSGSFLEAIRVMEEILEVKGHVLPVTVGNITLHGQSLARRQVHTEADFDRLGEILEDSDRIIKVWLEPNPLMLREVGQALVEADAIVIGPGDLFSSIAPVLLVKGISEAVRQAKARFVYVCNLMTKRGQTDKYRVSDFVTVVENYLNRQLDYIVCHTGTLDKGRVEKYRLEGAEPVQPRADEALEGRQVITAPLMAEGELARHDCRLLAIAIGNIIASAFSRLT